MKKIFFACLILLFHSMAAWAWTVEIAIGDVAVELPSHERHAAQSQEVLAVGSTIRTGPGAKAILVDGASEICISGDSQFKVESEPAAPKKLGMLHLFSGKLRAKLVRPPDAVVYPYELKLKATVAGVRGTEFIAIAGKDSDTVCTIEGKVHVEAIGNASESWDVPAGKTLIKPEGRAPVTQSSDGYQVEKWKRETSREHAPVSEKNLAPTRETSKSGRH